MKSIALAITAFAAALGLFATPQRAHAETMPGTACEGVFKKAKYYLIEGKLGVVYIEGRDGNETRARYNPVKVGNANSKVIQTSGVDANNQQKKFADDFYPPAKLPGWGWVVRSYEGDPDKTQFIWFARPEPEPTEIKPVTHE